MDTPLNGILEYNDSPYIFFSVQHNLPQIQQLSSQPNFTSDSKTMTDTKWPRSQWLARLNARGGLNQLCLKMPHFVTGWANIWLPGRGARKMRQFKHSRTIIIGSPRFFRPIFPENFATCKKATAFFALCETTSSGVSRIGVCEL
jgi:hypothetical protein